MTPQGIPASTAAPSNQKDQLGGGATLADRGIALGPVVDGGNAGKMDAVWAIVNLSATFVSGPLDIAHRLGRKPSIVWLVQQEGGGTVVVKNLNPENWTATAVRVEIYGSIGPGSLSNMQLTFLIA